MSCGNNSPFVGVGCQLAPCVPASVAQESTASMIDNLVQQLFGTIQKSTVNGRTVWQAPCSAEQAGLPGMPIGANEGLLCYVIRIMNAIGVFVGGVWSSAPTYPPQTLIAYGFSLYVALKANQNVVPGTDPTAWLLLLTAPTGPKGIQGDPGQPGAGGTPNYGTRSVTTGVTLTDTDDVVICNFASQADVTVPAGSGLLSGKRFLIKQVLGSAAVLIQMTGSDTLEGAATYLLNTPSESITFVQDGTSGAWYIL